MTITNTTFSDLRSSWEAVKHYDMLPATISYHNRSWDRIESHFSADALVSSVTHTAAVDWRNTMFARVPNNTVCSIERTRSMNTIARRVRDASSYLKFACQMGIIDHNPFAMVRCKFSAIPPSSRVVTEDEIEAILREIEPKRVKLLIALCYYAGLRRSEAERITIGEIDIARKRLTVSPPGGRTSSKHKRREVFMCPRLIEIISSSIHTGELVSQKAATSAWDLIRQAAYRAGVSEDGLCLQLMRSSRENIWMSQYPPNVVTAWMGHNAAIAATFYRAVPESYYQSENISALPIDTTQTRLRLCS